MAVSFQAASKHLFKLKNGPIEMLSSKSIATSFLRNTRSFVTKSSPTRRPKSATEISRSWASIRSLSVLSSSPSLYPMQRNNRQSYQINQRQQRRQASTWLPEALSSFSIWGGSGWMLKTLHMDGLIPYWACFAVINILVRLLLFPLVVHGAHTSARFAKVVPEVQFLLSLFSNDMKQLQKRKASWVERVGLMRMNLKSLGGIYKLHNINPFAVFLSPLLQLPIFWYVSVDLRKIVNGLDPQLAQSLVESSVAWIPDLTEPDPWYGLPVLAGVLLYANVEVAIGKRSLAGPNTSKADAGVLLKDIFQSFSVFMPCFTSQMPAGVQIYVATSFLFTMGQSAALRDATCRSLLGLPPLLPPGDSRNEPKYAQQFIRLKQLEQKAREIRGDGPLLGKGVLAENFECSFPGTYRKSTIEVSGSGMTSERVVSTTIKTTTGLDGASVTPKPHLDVSTSPFAQLPYVHGVSAPPWQIAEQRHLFEAPSKEEKVDPVAATVAVPDFSDEIMAKANRGEMPVPTKIVDHTSTNPTTRRMPVRVNRKQKKGSKKKR